MNDQHQKNFPVTPDPAGHPDRQLYRFRLLAIICLSITLRVLVAFFLGNQVVDMPGTFDQISYDMLARQLLAGKGFTVVEDWWPATAAGNPTAHWSYLYTLYLVAVYNLFGYSPLIARLIQAILAGLLMPWLLYRIGQRHFEPRVGLWAAGLAAVYIYFVYYAGNLVTETFFVVAILWSLDVSGQLLPTTNKPATSSPLMSGLLLGLALALAVLLRQVFLLFIPFLFAWLLWVNFKWQVRLAGQRLKILVIALGVLVLLIAPWTYRNYRVFNEMVLLNTNAGFAFFWGNHPIHGYNFVSILPPDGPSYGDLIPVELRGLNEAKLDRALLKEAILNIQADPVRYLILSVSRLKDYFKFWPSTDSSLLSNISRVLSFGLLWPFMAYGFLITLKQAFRSGTFFLHLFVIIFTGIHLLTWALIRYRLPVDAILLILAGVALVELQARFVRPWVPALNTKMANLLHLER